MAVCFAHGEKIAVLDQHLKPSLLVMDADRFYVAENAEISIYSLKDFKRIAKFGKSGEGPQEFKTQFGAPADGLTIVPMKDYILVNCISKILRFTKDGKFIDEKNTGSQFTSALQPVGKFYVGMSTGFDPGSGSVSLASALFDADFKKIREIRKTEVMNSSRLEQPQISPYFGVLDDKIILSTNEKFHLDILDTNGKVVGVIDRDYKPLSLTDTWQKRQLRLFEEVMKPYPGYYERFKKTIVFKSYFPAIQFCLVANRTIYIFTYLEKDNKTECFVYNDKGQFLKQVFTPVSNQSFASIFLQGIENNHYYRLIQNEEDENWELHADKIL